MGKSLKRHDFLMTYCLALWLIFISYGLFSYLMTYFSDLQLILCLIDRDLLFISHLPYYLMCLILSFPTCQVR